MLSREHKFFSSINKNVCSPILVTKFFCNKQFLLYNFHYFLVFLYKFTILLSFVEMEIIIFKLSFSNILSTSYVYMS